MSGLHPLNSWWRVLLAALVSVAFGVFPAAFLWVQVAPVMPGKPWPPSLASWFEPLEMAVGVLVLGLYPLAALGAIVATVAVWRRGRLRLLGAFAVIAFTVGTVIGWSSLEHGWRLRDSYVQQVPGRLKPVPAALGRYRGDHGAYPASLDRLVPDYLAAIPGTGMRGFPNVNYALTDASGDFAAHSGEPSVGYVLWVDLAVSDLTLYHHTSGVRRGDRARGVRQVDGWAIGEMR